MGGRNVDTLNENKELGRGQAAVGMQEEREDLGVYFGTCCTSGVSEIAKGGADSVGG